MKDGVNNKQYAAVEEKPLTKRKTQESPFGTVTLTNTKTNETRVCRREDALLQALVSGAPNKKFYDTILGRFKKIITCQEKLKSPLEFMTLDLVIFNYLRFMSYENSIDQIREKGVYGLPAIEMLERMAIRRQRLALKSMETLKSLKPAVNIKVNAGSQLNIGEKQINVQVQSNQEDKIVKKTISKFVVFLRKLFLQNAKG